MAFRVWDKLSLCLQNGNCDREDLILVKPKFHFKSTFKHSAGPTWCRNPWMWKKKSYNFTLSTTKLYRLQVPHAIFEGHPTSLVENIFFVSLMDNLYFVEKYDNFLGEFLQYVGWTYHKKVFVWWQLSRNSTDAWTRDVMWARLHIIIQFHSFHESV